MAILKRQASAITVAVALVAAAGAAGTLGPRTEDGLSVRSYRTDSPSHIPVIEATNRGPSSKKRPVALLVHGFQCNKSMMVPLAKRLAAAGCDAYAIDLPGHGASLERFSPERARDVTREALEAILATRGASAAGLVLVGHSYGANILAHTAGESLRSQAMVMLGPSYGGGLSRMTSGNLLVLTAEREPSQIVAFARDMIRDASGGALDMPGQSIGDPSRGDARAWQIVPSTDHVSLVFSDDALARTSTWIARSLGAAPSSDGPAASSALALALLTLTAAVALARVAATWSGTGLVEPEAARLTGPGWIAAVCVITLAVALLVGQRITALAWVRLLEGERIVSLIAIAGLAMMALGARRVSWPSASQIVRGLPVAAAAFALVYGGAVISLDEGLYRLSFIGIAPERWSAALVLAAAMLPFFAFSGAILEGIRTASGGGLRGASWAGAATIALCAAVAGAIQLMDPRLGRFAAPVGALCLFSLAVGALLTRAARNLAVGALFSSAVTAWVIAVGFVRY